METKSEHGAGHLVANTSRRRVLGVGVAGALACLTGGTASALAAPASQDMEARARGEQGVLIYSNLSNANMAPFLAGLKAKYPWLKVEALHLGPAEVFERYYSESSVGRRSADLIITAAPDAWLRFHEKDGIEPFAASESAVLPAWSKPLPGLYTFSTDPLVIVYNKLLLPADKRPQSLADLARLSSQFPGLFNRRITTYDAAKHAFAYVLQWTYARERGWPALEKVARATQLESSGATMIEKVTTGEYAVVYFASGATFFERLRQENRGDILGWTLIKDGTPLMPRGMAITRKSQNKASAGLVMNWLLSHDGQVNIAKGGLVPYRSDVKPAEVPVITYSQILEQLGPKNVIQIGYSPDMLREQAGFVAKWQATFNGGRK
ncbi:MULTISPECIES: ABC transporter substrate-binding protein [Pandoraea]|uniref:ABC transporter substrate-binding protein n=1 Tax=Pandoraea TaxID=93217 RepID=UPI001F5CFCEA|nr:MULTISPECIES: ABC transporter substrate-binding protein [Pandoraea]MCI3208312.1 hypothetical protein [Pandoraea sp. LA3]MDN4586341.1 hypothetical protein [Pandoraea capi]